MASIAVFDKSQRAKNLHLVPVSFHSGHVRRDIRLPGPIQGVRGDADMIIPLLAATTRAQDHCCLCGNCACHETWVA